MKFVIFTFLFVLLCSCNTIKYENDLIFLNSAQANSFEMMVKINGSVCMDMDKKVGGCWKRIRSNETIRFHQDALPYAYEFQFKCSDKLSDVDFSKSMEKSQPLDFELKPEKFNYEDSFTCTGTVTTDDPVGLKWEVRIKVYDSDYMPREEIYTQKKGKREGLVLGKYAWKSVVCIDNQCKHYTKKTVVELPRKWKVVKAYSDSKMLRRNYYGF